MRHPSVMQSQHTFSQVPKAQIERSSFDRSHGYKTTFDEGYLIPVLVDEVLPGDTFNLRMSAFCRVSSILRPIMDNLYVDSFFFFVPNRLLWTNWQKFNGEQTNPGDSTSFVVPYCDSPVGGYGENSLQDYMGIPTKVAGLRHSALWTRAYNLIWNQWFRDENLQNSVVVDVDDGPDTVTDYVLLKRGKRHDYFTSCLPWPQKGTAVSLPLGTTAPIMGLYVPNGNTIGIGTYLPNTGTAPAGVQSLSSAAVMGSSKSAVGTAPATAFNASNTDIYADLSGATAATINSLRQAFQIQKMYERDARGGTRYTEIVRSHFGVVSPDARLQRPEFLGGGSTPIMVHPVASTAALVPSPFPGYLGGFAASSTRGDGFTKSFTEHGVIVGLISVRADLNYQQGLNRMWSRSSRFDFFWPALAHLGEQAVLQKEIFADGTANDNIVFGYQERYAEYRYKPSLVTGRFRSNAATTLDLWHLAQNFAAAPTLNDAFIKEAPPMARVVQVVSEPHFFIDCYFKLNCVRPMPVYSIPGLTDHF